MYFSVIYLQRCNQNSVKHLRCSLIKIVNEQLIPATIFAKNFILDMWQGSEYTSDLGIILIVARVGQCIITRI